MNDARPNPPGLGTRIRTARRAHGLTQDQLARAVGVTRSAVAQWETDRAGQIGGNLARIARALGTTTEYLLIGQELPGAAPLPTQADEMALVRAYRECSPQDRALLLRTAVRLARTAGNEDTA
jgi:transcriptional regulator with XRE-family HTH domain